MVKLKKFIYSEFLTFEELEIKQEIFDKYKYALFAIGVDFTDEVLQEALINCHNGFEDALRATIAYWYYLRSQAEPFYPNACLLCAIGNNWSGRYWRDEYLENPDFKNPRDLFWESACEKLGYDLRNRAIIDVVERESDDEIYVVFCSGRSLRLSQINREGWDWLKEYCQEQTQVRS